MTKRKLPDDVREHLEILEALWGEKKESKAFGRKIATALRQLQKAWDAHPRLARRPHLDCKTCAEVPDHYETSSSPSRAPSFPPGFATLSELAPRKNFVGGRGVANVRCPTCKTRYLYKEGYEFLVGGSEDEFSLYRLDFQACIASTRIHVKNWPQCNTWECDRRMSNLFLAVRG